MFGRNSLTGFESTNTSNDAGRARFSSVPAGPGYAVVIDGIEVAADVRLRSNESRSLVLRRVDNIMVSGHRNALTAPAVNEGTGPDTCGDPAGGPGCQGGADRDIGQGNVSL